jgi:hypothetical protein
MTFFGAFLSALLGTAMVGAAARFIISLFNVSQPARFGGFCVALGFALARYSYGGPIDGRLLEVASAALGAVIALIGLWYWLMAEGAGVQTGEPK